MLDSGSHYYEVYETADGKYVAVGAVEPQFYAKLLQLTGLEEDEDFHIQNDRARWPRLKQKMQDRFRTKTREQWCAILEGSDACFAPVMSLDEATTHSHNVARQAFVEIGGVHEPAPAPRYSESKLDTPKQTVAGLEVIRSLLSELGYSDGQLAHLFAQGVIA